MIPINSTLLSYYSPTCKRFAIVTCFLLLPMHHALLMMIAPSLFFGDAASSLPRSPPGQSSPSKSGFRSTIDGGDTTTVPSSKQSQVASFLTGPIMPRKGRDFVRRMTKRPTSTRPTTSPRADGVQRHSKSKDNVITKNYSYHLTILIPAYNERYRIGDTLYTYMNYLSNTPVYQHHHHHHPSSLGMVGGHDGAISSSCSSRQPAVSSSGTVSILVVDDGSSDGTADYIEGKSWWNSSTSSFAEQHAEKDNNCWNVDENVLLISLPTNSGKGAAIERGMAELPPSPLPCSSSSNGDSNNSDEEFARSIVLVADADGSGDISCIDGMLHCMEEMLFSTSEGGMTAARPAAAAGRYPFDDRPPPAVVVVGSRRYPGRKSPPRALLSWGFRACVSAVFVGGDLGVRDTQCGFKLMTSSAGRVLYRDLNLKGWTQDVEVIYRARAMGIPVGQCDVPWVDKEGSKLVSNASDAIFVSLEMLSEIANMRLRYALGVWKVPSSQC